MSRVCERPGCSAPASIAYGIDPDRLVVWLDVLDDQLAGDRRIGVLCRRHADAMVVPLGWMLDDHREPTPRLFKVGEAEATGEIIRQRRSTARPPRAEQLELVATPLPATLDDDAISERIAGLLADDTAQLERTVLQAELERTEASKLVAASRMLTPDRIAAPPAETAISRDSESTCSGGAPVTSQPVAEEPVVAEPPAEQEPVAEAAGDEAARPGEYVAATLWSPVFDEADDLGGLLTASSPLLSRAFGNRAARPRKGKKRG